MNASVLKVEIFSPGDGAQYHLMLTELDNTYIISVLNQNICFHFNKDFKLDEEYVCGRLRGVKSGTIKAMLCWVSQLGLNINASYTKPNDYYGINKFPELSEHAGRVLS